ncbi:MAG: alpha/beta fold hydrolase [Burkholderiales bacterium]|nr:alpha/beta fold hydrolase [Burkholderiales bacterium]
MGAESLRWGTGPAWPNAAASRFVDAAGLRWHLQRLGAAGAPPLLLLHGTGASTHSWRGLLPLLAARFDTLALDLPGHAYTATPGPAGLGLPGMASEIGELLRELGFAPAVIVGHSAGAAIAAQMALAGHARPRALVGLNAALLPLHGLAGQLFSPLAKLLALNPLVPRLFAWRAADPRVLQRLLDGTGSSLDGEGRALYRRLVADPAHVAGALGMMANWDLDTLARALPRLAVPLHLLVGGADRTVPPAQAAQVQALLPGTRVVVLEGLGHLAHEEQPARVADEISRIAGAD